MMDPYTASLSLLLHGFFLVVQEGLQHTIGVCFGPSGITVVCESRLSIWWTCRICSMQSSSYAFNARVIKPSEIWEAYLVGRVIVYQHYEFYLEAVGPIDLVQLENEDRDLCSLTGRSISHVQYSIGTGRLRFALWSGFLPPGRWSLFFGSFL